MGVGKLLNIFLTRIKSIGRIRDKSMFPWLGFLFTYPDYRGNRYSEKLLKYVEEEAKSENYLIVYLRTDHTGLYEKYGYTYLGESINAGQAYIVIEKDVD